MIDILLLRLEKGTHYGIESNTSNHEIRSHWKPIKQRLPNKTINFDSSPINPLKTLKMDFGVHFLGYQIVFSSKRIKHFRVLSLFPAIYMSTMFP